MKALDRMTTDDNVAQCDDNNTTTVLGMGWFVIGLRGFDRAGSTSINYI
jgi:hypothetical protein